MPGKLPIPRGITCVLATWLCLVACSHTRPPRSISGTLASEAFPASAPSALAELRALGYTANDSFVEQSGYELEFVHIKAQVDQALDSTCTWNVYLSHPGNWTPLLAQQSPNTAVSLGVDGTLNQVAAKNHLDQATTTEINGLNGTGFNIGTSAGSVTLDLAFVVVPAATFYAHPMTSGTVPADFHVDAYPAIACRTASNIIGSPLAHATLAAGVTQ